MLFFAALSLGSCKKDFLDVNDNPNLPEEVPVNIILPAAQASLAYDFGGDIARFNAIMAQNVTGVGRQFIGYNSYVFTEEDFNNLWNNMYAGNMSDLYKIMEKAKATPGAYDGYDGVAKIIMAYSLGTMTDLFGDVPYTEAFKGNASLTPKYQTQQEIYETILPELLNSAIADFANTGDDFVLPGGDDKIYGGDLAKWTSLANGLKARFAIHLTKINPGAAQAALDAINAGGLASMDDDAQFGFGGTYQNPWYQYIDQRADISYSSIDYYYGVGCFLSDTMEASGDPRYGAVIDTGGTYYAPGFPSALYMGDDAPVYFFTYFEQKFIEAEAKLLTGDDAGAEISLHEAVTANMEKLGVDSADNATYQTANVVWTGTTQDKLNLIMFQKYVANYLQPESWTDWRRTGQPNLQPNAGSTSPIPRRYIYPTNERLYNPNASNASTTMLTPRLWWDN
ncbi:MAG: SusD/RagB family nutrient-binding outer membrane lipoprotein [Bacteroidetes bacterium]|nr:SusD/RagB family nutrient-binding outer membrane lipoprotein [Bacteroidota bacterium]